MEIKPKAQRTKLDKYILQRQINNSNIKKSKDSETKHRLYINFLQIQIKTKRIYKKYMMSSQKHFVHVSNIKSSKAFWM